MNQPKWMKDLFKEASVTDLKFVAKLLQDALDTYGKVVSPATGKCLKQIKTELKRRTKGA